MRFGRRHPALTVAGLAGAGLFGGVELATGVLLGASVAALIRRPNGAAPTQSAARRAGGLHRFLARTPHDLHELKERARSVMQAARGDFTPSTQPAQEEPRPAQEAPV